MTRGHLLIPASQSAAQVASAIESAVAASSPTKPAMATGQYYDIRHAYGGIVQNFTMIANFLYACPFWLPEPTTFDRIAVNVITPGAGATTLRMGIFSPSGTNPGARLLDAGTTAADVGGTREIIISQLAPAGLSFLAISSTGAPVITGIIDTTFGYGHPSPLFDHVELSAIQSGGGAFPNPFGVPVAFGASAPLITLRAA